MVLWLWFKTQSLNLRPSELIRLLPPWTLWSLSLSVKQTFLSFWLLGLVTERCVFLRYMLMHNLLMTQRTEACCVPIVRTGEVVTLAMAWWCSQPLVTRSRIVVSQMDSQMILLKVLHQHFGPPVQNKSEPAFMDKSKSHFKERANPVRRRLIRATFHWDETFDKLVFFHSTKILESLYVVGTESGIIDTELLVFWERQRHKPTIKICTYWMRGGT